MSYNKEMVDLTKVKIEIDSDDQLDYQSDMEISYEVLEPSNNVTVTPAMATSGKTKSFVQRPSKAGPSHRDRVRGNMKCTTRVTKSIALDVEPMDTSEDIIDLTKDDDQEIRHKDTANPLVMMLEDILQDSEHKPKIRTSNDIIFKPKRL